MAEINNPAINIPSIDGRSNIPLQKNFSEIEKKKAFSRFGKEPSNISGWSLLGKITIALII